MGEICRGEQIYVSASEKQTRSQENEKLNISNIFPYTCAPYPDELIGSWISRLVVLNAQRSFVLFANKLGLRVNPCTFVANPVNGGKYIKSLSEALGLKNNTFLHQFTTRSYWDAFSPRSRTQDEDCSLKNRYSSLPLLRICPDCIQDDTKTVGYAYLHRTHQLPSPACPHHPLLLQDSCGVCGLPILLTSSLTLIPHRCQCGADIPATLKRESASETWQALATFTHNALNGSSNELDSFHLSAFAVSCAVAKQKLSFKESLRRVLIECYGSSGLEWLCRRNEAHAVNVDPKRPFAFTSNKLRPPLIAAVLVGCGVTVDGAKFYVASHRGSVISNSLVTKNNRKESNYFPDSVEEAKQMALEFAAKPFRKAKFKTLRPFVFWMLYLKEKAWLFDKIISKGSGWSRFTENLPSITKDRETILGAQGKSVKKMARARAFTRDKSWFEIYIKKNKSKNRESKMRNDNIIEALMSEKSKHLAETGRPIKWTVRLAAKRLRIPQLVLTALIRRDSRMRAYVPESSREFLIRAIEWSISICEQKPIPLTLENIRRTARLSGIGNTDVINSFLEKRIH
jgi:hypothetical protein